MMKRFFVLLLYTFKYGIIYFDWIFLFQLRNPPVFHHLLIIVNYRAFRIFKTSLFWLCMNSRDVQK